MNITPWVELVIKKSLDENDDQWIDLAEDSVFLESLMTGSIPKSIRKIQLGLKGVCFVFKPTWVGSDRPDEYAWDEIDFWNHEKKTLYGHVITSSKFRLSGMDDSSCRLMYYSLVRYSIMAHVAVSGAFPTMLKGVNYGLLSESEKPFYDANGYPTEYLKANLLAYLQ